MRFEIRPAAPSDIPALRALWQEAFGDEAPVLDAFFAAGFAPERSRVLALEGQPVSVLYWFDGSWDGRRFAYLYAVATEARVRGRGYSTRLLEDTCRHLSQLGYDAALLVPGSAELFDFYARCGFVPCCPMDITAQAAPADGRPVTPAEYERIRQRWLPPQAAALTGAALSYFGRMGQFYVCPGGCAAVLPQDPGGFFAMESFGTAPMPGPGSLRRPGGKNFAMIRPLTPDAVPFPTAFYMALD